MTRADVLAEALADASTCVRPDMRDDPRWARTLALVALGALSEAGRARSAEVERLFDPVRWLSGHEQASAARHPSVADDSRPLRVLQGGNGDDPPIPMAASAYEQAQPSPAKILCPVCGDGPFNIPAGIARHTKAKHPDGVLLGIEAVDEPVHAVDDAPEPSSPPVDDQPEPEPDDDRPFRCDRCGRGFATITDLSVHESRCERQVASAPTPTKVLRCGVESCGWTTEAGVLASERDMAKHTRSAHGRDPFRSELTSTRADA